MKKRKRSGAAVARNRRPTYFRPHTPSSAVGSVVGPLVPSGSARPHRRLVMPFGKAWAVVRACLQRGGYPVIAFGAFCKYVANKTLCQNFMEKKQNFPW